MPHRHTCTHPHTLAATHTQSVLVSNTHTDTHLHTLVVLWGMAKLVSCCTWLQSKSILKINISIYLCVFVHLNGILCMCFIGAKQGQNNWTFISNWINIENLINQFWLNWIQFTWKLNSLPGLLNLSVWFCKP